MRRLLWGLAVAALVAAGQSHVRADDLEVASQIADNLKESGLMQGYSIGVKVLQGSALLRGKVASEEQRQTALYIARQTEGVEQVMDELTIAPANGAAPGLSKAKKALLTSNRNAIQQTGANMRTQPAVGGNKPLPRGFAPSGQVAPTNPQLASTAGFPRHHGHGHFGRNGGGVPIDAAPAYEGDGAISSGSGGPVPAFVPGLGGGGPTRYEQPYLPKHAWPAYAAYPNYGAVTYPQQYSPTAWPYIGPFYPYPQVPLGWRKVTLEWDDGWWFLDFKARRH